MKQKGLIFKVAMIALLGLAGSAWAQQQPRRSIVSVTGNLYRAQNNNHFTAFLVTAEGIILSDTINRDFATWLKSELDDRFGLPVRYVLYSHSDADHASGGEVFADTAEFVGHENMRDGVPNGVHPPTTFYSDRHLVTLGGKSVEMIYPGPAHSANMSVLHFLDENAVFVVDFISIKRLPFQNLTGYALEVWLSEMRTVEALGADIVIPGHGQVGTTADVVDHRHYVEELRDAVAAGISAGRSLAQLQESITLEDYRGWASFDAWRAPNIEGMYNMLREN